MTDERTIYPPLTREEFDDGCAGTYKSVGICEDESGSFMYAWGHVPPATMLAALDAYAQEMWHFSPREAEFTAADVRHRWAQTIQPPDGPDGWWISFADDITADSPQAWAVTVIEQ